MPANSCDSPGGTLTETNEYDTQGRLRRHIDFEGQGTGYFYNDLGQLEYKNYYTTSSSYDPDDYDAGWDEQIVYTYDSLGRMKTETEARGTTTYYYDEEGNTEQIDSPEGTIYYEYSPITGRKVRTWTTNTETTFAYDDLGRLKETKLLKRDGTPLTNPEVTTYDYDDVGNRAHQWIDQDNNQTNDLTTTYTYDNLNRLTDLVQSSTTAQLASYVYTPAADGMRGTITEIQAQPSASTESRTITNGYDNLNRLTSESATGNSGSYSITYTYDLVGNRLSRTVNANGQELGTIYTYNDLDQLVTESHSGPTCVFRQGDKVYYGYANPGGTGVYFKDKDGTRIGCLRALWTGLPTRLPGMALVPVLVLLPVLFFWSSLVNLYLALRHRQPALAKVRISRRGICLFLAVVMLLSPEGLVQLAQADVQYSQLCTNIRAHPASAAAFMQGEFYGRG